MQFNPSIKKRLSLAVSFMIIVLISTVSFITLNQFENNTKSLIEKDQFKTVSLLANEIDDKLSNAMELLSALAQQFNHAEINHPRNAERFLTSHAEIKAMFNNGVFLFNQKGIMVAETQNSGRVGQDFSFREYLATTLSIRKPYIGDPYVSSQQHNHPAIMLTTPILNAQGELIGVLAGSIDLMSDNVLGRIAEMKHARTGYYFLITKGRNLILHPDKNRIMSKDVNEGANKSLEKAIRGFEGSEETITSRGIRSIASFKSLKSKEWVVGANYPVSEAYEPIYKARNTVVITTVFLTFLVTAIVWYLMNVITKPLLEFTNHVESLSQKLGEERLMPVISRDEIGRLSAAFNRMISDLDLKQHELESQKERLSVTLRSIADGVIVTDVNGNLVMMNRIAEKLTGWPFEEVAGRPLDSFFTIIDERKRETVASPVDIVLSTGTIATIPKATLLLSRNGSEYFISDSCAPIKDSESHTIGAVLVFQDITEKRRLEEENLRAEKLESIGVLAGGIAHDFNNLLTAILGNISLAKLIAPQSDNKLIEKLDAAEFASLRAKDLTHRLLTFSQGGAPIRKSLRLPALLNNYVGLALSGSNTCCVFNIPDDLWPVEADEGQLGQVISNLIINADQAMPDGGTIHIACSNLTITDNTQLPLECGRYVCMSISDEGIGIAEEHLKRIFEPYFSNKAKGRGLGLATVYSIVMNHFGHISVKSLLGTGTTFSVYLPASETYIQEAAQEKALLEQAKGRILIMDDEDIVKMVAGEILGHIGYDVDYSSNGDEALEMYSNALQHNRPFDVVVMDLTIPGGMGGKEAVLKLREINPKAKAIVSSGYSNDPILSDFRHYKFDGAVLKPYNAEELGKAIQHVISS